MTFLLPDTTHKIRSHNGQNVAQNEIFPRTKSFLRLDAIFPLVLQLNSYS